MQTYSFLSENFLGRAIGHKIKNIHLGNGYAFVDNYQHDKTIREFIAKLTTCNTIDDAINIYNIECKKLFFMRIPKKYLESIGNILNTSTEDNFREKLQNYLDISFS